jgi:WD40 repeat protein
MARIFISHASENNAAALAVATWLEQNGWGDYFLDIMPQQGLVPGQRWEQALKGASSRCEAVLCLISPAWRASTWCLAEFLLAKQLGKTIVGVLIEETRLDTLPHELTGEWQLCNLVTGTDRRAFTVHAEQVVPVTDVSLSAAGLERLRIGLKKAGLDPATFQWPPAHDPERPPYRGLKPLGPDDAAIYFGRDVAISRALDVLRQIRQRGVEGLFVILGASGAGKSSFLGAGLWPRLLRDDLSFAPLPAVRPQGAPITGPMGLILGLETAFRARGVPRTRASIREALGRASGLADLVFELRGHSHKAIGGPNRPPTIILPIDQAEELFERDGPAENQEFLALVGGALTAAATEPSAAFIVIIAVRSDSYERLQAEPNLAAMPHVPFNLSPIGRAEFKSIIVGPAERASAAGRPLVIDPRLTDRLLDDSKGADALPLLAFTLERLYADFGGAGSLSERDYDVLGGVRGSLDQAVAAAVTNPTVAPPVPTDPGERERLLRRALFPYIARIDPDTEERLRRVARQEEIPAAAHPLLDRLVDARLFVRDRRADGTGRASVVVEVAHEALLRQWAALASWLDEHVDALKVLEAVRRASAEWLRNGRHPAWLVHAAERLKSANDAIHRQGLQQLIDDVGEEYLAACDARQEQVRLDREQQVAHVEREQHRTARAQRFARWQLLALGLVLAVVGLAVGLQSREVALQRARVLTGAAEQALKDGHYSSAIRFAVLAMRSSLMSPTVADAEPTLLHALYMSPDVVHLAHDGSIANVTFSSDGARAATSSADRTARVWDVGTGKELIRVRHDDAVRDADLSRDGRHLVTGSADRTARVWDVARGVEIARVVHESEVADVGFSPDGSLIVTAASGMTRVSNAVTGQEISRSATGGEVTQASFSSDGKHVLILDSAVVGAGLWESATGKDVDGSSRVSAASLSADGKRVAFVTVDDFAIVKGVTARDGVVFHPGSSVVTVAFSPDGRRIVTGATDGTARVWNTQTGKEIARVAHGRDVIAVSFRPDGRRVLSTSRNGTAWLWEADTGEVILRAPHESSTWGAVWDPTGRVIATAAESNVVRLWELHSERGRGLAVPEIATVAVSRDGQQVLTASRDHTARVWDAQTGRERARVTHPTRVRTADFSPDESQVISASDDGTVIVWRSQTGQEILAVARDRPQTVAFSADGQHVLSADYVSAQIWEASTGKEIARIPLEARETPSFSSDFRSIVTTSKDRTIRIWNIQTGKDMMRPVHEEAWRVALSPDGRRLVTFSGDDARIWNVSVGQELARLRAGGSEAIFSPNANRLVFRDTSSSVIVWSADTGDEVRRVTADDFVEDARFTPDSRRIFTRSSTDLLQIWDVLTGREIAREANVQTAAFAHDGRYMAIGGEDHARVIDTRLLLDSSRVLETACDEKLIGARRITARDLQLAPILFGQEGEDVCQRPSVLQRLSSWLPSRRN